MYKIVITPEAQRALKKLKLSRIHRGVIVKAIDSLATDPLRGQPLRKELKGFFKLRAGSYRIIYEINRGRLIVIIIAVGDRKNIYQRLSRRAKLI